MIQFRGMTKLAKAAHFGAFFRRTYHWLLVDVVKNPVMP